MLERVHFNLTDAIACDSFINDARFHNNLYLATVHAKANGLNVQNDSEDVGHYAISI